MPIKLFLIAATLAAVVGAVRAAPDYVRVPDPEKVLDTLAPKHPRLILTDARLAELKALAGTDELLAGAVKDVLSRADRLVGEPKLVRKIIGPRLLRVSRECRHRMYTLGLAWRWTGREKYLRKAVEDMLAVCEFKDWNPRHFLDVAEMAHAAGVGYDWFHSALDADTRKRIAAGLRRHGLQAGLKGYAENAGWSRSGHNWNQVCNFGLTVAALAVAEEYPDEAARLIPRAVAAVPRALKTYAPDGAWPEGPGYWGYATRYTVYGLSALQTALGTDFGLSDAPGLDKAGEFPIHMAGPTGLLFNFADVGKGKRLKNTPSLFWLARRYGRPLFAHTEREAIRRYGGRARDVIWYVPDEDPSAEPDPPLAKRFDGPVPVAVFRTAWYEPDALFVAVKAGYNQVNHGHLDLGQFAVSALGVRWARELGSDHYNLPGYWGRAADAQRWKYYRLGSLSHNIPLIDNANQDVHAKAELTAFVPSGTDGLAKVDLTDAYKPAATKALRGVRLLAGRAVLVQDELTLDGSHEVAWGMTTEAAIEPAGRQAVLRQDGKALTARLLSPAGARFTVESCRQQPPQATNEGFRRLMLRIPDAEGLCRIAVLLLPHWPDGAYDKPVKVQPLSQWPKAK